MRAYHPIIRTEPDIGSLKRYIALITANLSILTIKNERLVSLKKMLKIVKGQYVFD